MTSNESLTEVRVDRSAGSEVGCLTSSSAPDVISKKEVSEISSCSTLDTFGTELWVNSVKEVNLR